ncbi:MAG: helix-turn-helix domain-containing protein [Parvibaculum sp.]|uniref:helix-turn-helix domain-containing protein n=1 Tax=Parvibaculum sp. TaxID=2024848 RepID=UPI003C767445
MLERRIGAALREARCEKNLTLAEISGRLHIRESHLDAIERGEAEACFPRFYLVAHARSYANVLGVDMGDDLDALSAELRRERDQTVPEFKVPESTSLFRRAQGWVLMIGLAFGGLLFYLGAGDAAPEVHVAGGDTVEAVVDKAPEQASTSEQAPASAQASAPESRAVEVSSAPAPVETKAPEAEKVAATPVVAAPDVAAPVAAAPDAVRERSAPARTKLVAKSVYLRQGPTVASPAVGTVIRCTRVVVERVDSRSGWVEVVNSAERGYLHRSFLKDAMPACREDGADGTR